MCVPIHYNYPMIKLLHFADAHIDIANYGAHDPRTGLPLRVMDFLKSLDTIVETAIEEKVDMVIFAGDAYKDRNPVPNPISREAMMKSSWKVNSTKRKSSL